MLVLPKPIVVQPSWISSESSPPHTVKSQTCNELQLARSIFMYWTLIVLWRMYQQKGVGLKLCLQAWLRPNCNWDDHSWSTFLNMCRCGMGYMQAYGILFLIQVHTYQGISLHAESIIERQEMKAFCWLSGLGHNPTVLVRYETCITSQSPHCHSSIVSWSCTLDSRQCTMSFVACF